MFLEAIYELYIGGPEFLCHLEVLVFDFFDQLWSQVLGQSVHVEVSHAYFFYVFKDLVSLWKYALHVISHQI